MVQFNFSESNQFAKNNQPAPGLKKIDSNELVKQGRELLFQYKIEAIAVLVGISFLIGIYLFLSSKIQLLSDLDQEIKTLTEKVTPVKDFKKLVDDEVALQKIIPKHLPENRFISVLTAYSGKRNIAIKSVTPPDVKEFGYYKAVSSQLSGQAKSFLELLLLVYDLEQSEFALKVENFTVNRAAGSFETVNSTNDQKLVLTFSMTVTSIEVFSNEKNKKKN